VTTVEEQLLPARRRRRRYSEQFKARVVADCQVTGVSVAAVALEDRLNSNLLRRCQHSSPLLSRRRMHIRARSVSKRVAEISR
jgi:transposase-like protein